MAHWSEGALFLAGGSWGAGSNSGVATCSFFYFFLSSYFYPSAFYCLFSLLTVSFARLLRKHISSFVKA